MKVLLLKKCNFMLPHKNNPSSLKRHNKFFSIFASEISYTYIPKPQQTKSYEHTPTPKDTAYPSGGSHKRVTTGMDVPSIKDTVGTSDSGLTPRTIPGGCSDVQNGVSVEYVPEEKADHEWYVFRASYSREEKASDLLSSLNATSYVARHTIYTKTKSGVKSAVKILLPNLVFAYLTKEESELFVKGPVLQEALFKSKTDEEKKRVLKLSEIISYYYNHFKTENGKNPPLTIPYKDMERFIIATGTAKDVMPIDEREFEIGEEVEVIMGEFKGLRGKVMRKQSGKKKLMVQLHDNAPQPPVQGGKRRLVFQLSCLGSFCSALIPAVYFRKVENGE